MSMPTTFANRVGEPDPGRPICITGITGHAISITGDTRAIWHGVPTTLLTGLANPIQGIPSISPLQYAAYQTVVSTSCRPVEAPRQGKTNMLHITTPLVKSIHRECYLCRQQGQHIWKCLIHFRAPAHPVTGLATGEAHYRIPVSMNRAQLRP